MDKRKKRCYFTNLTLVNNLYYQFGYIQNPEFAGKITF